MAACGRHAGEREQRSIDLMRIQIDLSVCQGSGELLNAVRSAALCELVSKILRVIFGEAVHAVSKPNVEGLRTDLLNIVLVKRAAVHVHHGFIRPRFNLRQILNHSVSSDPTVPH
jgi:hypothetical protein